MNILIWFVQIVLAIKLITVTIGHGFRQNQPKMQEAIQKMGESSRALHFLIAGLTLVGCVGVVLPTALGVFPWITVGTAVVTAILMLVSIPFHIRSRQTPNVFASLILGAMAVFAAYGRWVLVPG